MPHTALGQLSGLCRNLCNFGQWERLEPKLLHRVFARVEASRDLAYGGKHGDPAVVELPGTHLIRVVIEPWQRVTEVAWFLLLILDEHGGLQDADECEHREAPDHAAH